MKVFLTAFIKLNAQILKNEQKKQRSVPYFDTPLSFLILSPAKKSNTNHPFRHHRVR